MVKNNKKKWFALQEMQVQFLGWEVPLEKKMTTRCSILAWEIPWTRSLAGYSPWGHKELYTTEATEHAHTYLKMSFTG